MKYSIKDMETGIHLLYSAHGVPESYIEAGDPYQVSLFL
jgi:protoheme ferro-lyase